MWIANSPTFPAKKNIEIVSKAYYKGVDKLVELYTKVAGPKRNQQMANYADALIAFWDGKSRGTKNMIDFAEQLGLKLIINCFRKLHA